MEYLIVLQVILYLIAIILGFKFFVINKSPLYFKLIFSAVVCFFLKNLYYLVGYACTGIWQNTSSFASFSAGAGYAFLFSANYGQFDSFVDDSSKQCKKAKNAAFVMPIVLIITYILVFIYCIKTYNSILYVLLTVISKLPLFFAAYYHLKHLILPDAMHFMVDSLRPFNAVCLLLITIDTASDVLSILGHIHAARICETVIALLFVLIIFTAERGHRQWKA